MSSPVEYRPWPRHPGYLVGDDGTVIGARGRPRVLFPVKGYPCFSAHIDTGTGYGARSTLVHVHVAVCETFHGPRPPGHQAAHENGTPTDCRAVNISWKTPAGNAADKVRHGTHNRGEQHYGHKLTADQVRTIRASHESIRSLAERFNVSKSAIKSIRSGRTWATTR